MPLLVLHEHVGRDEGAEDADVGLEDLHGVGLVEVDVVDDEADGAVELGHVAHDGEGVEGVHQGQAVPAEHVVDVDVARVRGVRAATWGKKRKERLIKS